MEITHERLNFPLTTRMVEALKNSWYVVSAYNDDKLVASGRIVSDGVIQCFVCEMMVLPELLKLQE
jgi:hypothetical protein